MDRVFRRSVTASPDCNHNPVCVVAHRTGRGNMPEAQGRYAMRPTHGRSHRRNMFGCTVSVREKYRVLLAMLLGECQTRQCRSAVVSMHISIWQNARFAMAVHHRQ
jgi:hypothetical protein